ncbi:putative hydroxypyruvate isomerase [Amphibalanus amphitrite]|nr:putative hydroxypyruvate isomerase [Amphibalanus amphitrite]
MSGVATREAGADTYERNIRLAADRLSQEGIVGLIEPISPQAVPGYFLNDYGYVRCRDRSFSPIGWHPTALDLVKRIDSESLRLQVDLFHLQNIAGNITNNLKELLPYTGHVQLAQPPHRHEPGVPGELDFGYVLPLLEQLGYSGWVGCEYVPSTSSEESLSWVRRLGYSL